MQLEARPAGPLTGVARPPSDKSISHRALLLAAMADGVSQADQILEGADVLATAAAVRALGADLDRTGEDCWRIRGRGRLAAPRDDIDCGNAGTGVRLLMGAIAGYPIRATLTGDASLRRRPMRRVLDPLMQMGVRAVCADGGRLPATLDGGGLSAIAYTLPVASAQVKSAILLAGLNAEGLTEIIEPERTRDHTERMLQGFGARLEGGETPAGWRIAIAGGQRLSPAHIRAPADPSSAAFPIVAALITPGSHIRLTGVLLNPLRTGLFETLRDMGADLRIENERAETGETIGDVIVSHSPLRGVVVPPERAPSMIDEYPILAVAAAFASGETIMRGVGEMRVKESDRIALMTQGLRACGVAVEEEADGFIVTADGTPPPGGARVATTGDHRIAMAHLVLGLAARAPVKVDEADMIDTSFPAFAAFMRRLGADIS
ncbi:MAG: 3-phosphoshikimate 1-carboxyvinyltransferase [Alphaproteobacteria bacterium]|nr:3-phosphoshikimate 1-carboxyvinyltransferase [Alphaproteobacteria bacterium]